MPLQIPAQLYTGNSGSLCPALNGIAVANRSGCLDDFYIRAAIGNKITGTEPAHRETVAVEWPGGEARHKRRLGDYNCAVSQSCWRFSPAQGLEQKGGAAARVRSITPQRGRHQNTESGPSGGPHLSLCRDRTILAPLLGFKNASEAPQFSVTTIASVRSRCSLSVSVVRHCRATAPAELKITAIAVGRNAANDRCC